MCHILYVHCYIFPTVDALSVAMTSTAISTGAKFPFVTLPHYEIRAANARVLSTSYVINYSPVVSESQLDEWNTFSAESAFDQYFSSLARETAQRDAQDERFAKTGSNGRRRRFLQEATPPPAPQVHPLVLGTNASIALPLWQESPVTAVFSGVLNLDVTSLPAAFGAYDAVLKQRRATLGPANLEIDRESTLAEYLTYLYGLSQYREIVQEVAYDPTSTLSYPVFDSFDYETRKVTGVFGLNINWRSIFQGVVPSNVRGIYCIIENSFNQTFTVRIDGEDAMFIGTGDLHETAYDDLVMRANAQEYLESINSPLTRSYTSVGLDYDYCTFSLRVYPSADMEAEYRNHHGRVFSILIVGVFCFTSFLFVAYDCLVGRRQRNIMRRAVISSAIVSSLFPTQVREQLYLEQEVDQGNTLQDDHEEEDAREMILRVKRRRRSTMGTSLNCQNARPIAHQFENTTIMFADLAGFTRWSAQRTPEHVFELLEALYARFDAAARARGVFKVETIGKFSEVAKCD